MHKITDPALALWAICIVMAKVEPPGEAEVAAVKERFAAAGFDPHVGS